MSDIPSPIPSPAQLEELFPGVESPGPLVGILMGSESDRPVMEKAGAELEARALSYEMRVISAHRNPKEVAAYADDVRRRLAVKPGMTGLWQVSGRSDLPWEEAVRLDLRYVENWSLSLDLVILLRTMTAVVRSSGAY